MLFNEGLAWGRWYSWAIISRVLDSRGIDVFYIGEGLLRVKTARSSRYLPIKLVAKRLVLSLADLVGNL